MAQDSEMAGVEGGDAAEEASGDESEDLEAESSGSEDELEGEEEEGEEAAEDAMETDDVQKPLGTNGTPQVDAIMA